MEATDLPKIPRCTRSFYIDRAKLFASYLRRVLQQEGEEYVCYTLLLALRTVLPCSNRWPDRKKRGGYKTDRNERPRRYPPSICILITRCVWTIVEGTSKNIPFLYKQSFSRRKERFYRKSRDKLRGSAQICQTILSFGSFFPVRRKRNTFSRKRNWKIVSAIPFQFQFQVSLKCCWLVPICVENLRSKFTSVNVTRNEAHLSLETSNFEKRNFERQISRGAVRSLFDEYPIMNLSTVRHSRKSRMKGRESGERNVWEEKNISPRRCQ